MKKTFSITIFLAFGLLAVAALGIAATQAIGAERKLCWCRVDGHVVQMSPEMCKEKRGRCFSTKAEAEKNCQENLCWCCVDGHVVQMSPEMCKEKRGRCFSTKAEAERYCQANLCWCCVKGEVAQVTATECKKKNGICYRTQEEAVKRCPKQDKLPDITSRKGMTIGGAVGGAGGKFVSFGDTVVLTDADSFLQSGGQCAFNISYNMVNIGSAPTAPVFKNRIRSDGTVVTIQSNLSLNAGQSRQINTQAYLAPGQHALTLSLDDDHAVNESNEGNNKFGVTVMLRGACKK